MTNTETTTSEAVDRGRTCPGCHANYGERSKYARDHSRVYCFAADCTVREETLEAQTAHLPEWRIVPQPREHVITDEEHRAWCRAGCPMTDAEIAAGRPSSRVRKTNQGDDDMSKTTKTDSTPRVTPTVRYYRDGQAVTDSVNKLSTIAYHFTKGIDGDARRISSGALRALLVKLGVTEPETTTWHVRLPNGVALGAVVPGDKLPAAPAGGPKTSTSTTKAAASKTGAKRQPAKAAGTKKAASQPRRPAAKRTASKGTGAAKRTSTKRTAA